MSVEKRGTSHLLLVFVRLSLVPVRYLSIPELGSILDTFVVNLPKTKESIIQPIR